jgi:transposase, IS5 family
MIGRAGNAVGQLGFYDLDKRLEAISGKGDPLEPLNIIVPFESFRAEIEAVIRLAPEERKSNAGRRPFQRTQAAQQP